MYNKEKQIKGRFMELNEELRKKIIIFTTGFGNNIMYALILFILSYTNQTGVENPYMSLFYFGIGAGISMLINIFIIRLGYMEDKDQTYFITRLAVSHVVSLIGLIYAMIYLFF
jgi:hypothetical protein